MASRLWQAVTYNRLFAWKESFAVVPDVLGDCFVSNEFPQFLVDETRVLPRFLCLFFLCRQTISSVNKASIGSAAISRNRFKEENFLGFSVAIPPLSHQHSIVARWQGAQKKVEEAKADAAEKERRIALWLYDTLGTPSPIASEKVPRCFALRWQEVDRWSYNYIVRSRQGLLGLKSKFPIVPLEQCLVDTGNGYCIKPVTGPTPFRMLKLNALTPAGLDLTKTKFVDVPAKVAERFSLRKDDLLVCRSVGSYEMVGRSTRR